MITARSRFHDSLSVIDGTTSPEGSVLSPSWTASFPEPFSPLVAEGYPDACLPNSRDQKAMGSWVPHVLDSVLEGSGGGKMAGESPVPTILIADDNPINIKVRAYPFGGAASAHPNLPRARS